MSVRVWRSLKYDGGAPVEAGQTEEELLAVAIGYARRNMWAAAFITLGMAIARPMPKLNKLTYAEWYRQKAIETAFGACHSAFLELSRLYTDDAL